MLNKAILTTEYAKELPCVILLGGFDGVHCGHARLFARAKTYGLPIGIMTILGGKEGSLYSLKEREEIFQKRGADFVLSADFSQIKNLSPEEFICLITSRFPVKRFVCGRDFRFGYGAAGTPSDIEKICGVGVDVEDLLEIEGEKVSTRNVKKLLALGKVEKAKEYLGEGYFVAGRVEKGRKVGRLLGFPTANVEYPKDKYLIKSGVYETRVVVCGTEYKGITNFGARPTFEDGQVWLETYLDGFSGNLYGQEIKIEFVRFLREVERFDSPEKLKAQLECDLRRIRTND